MVAPHETEVGGEPIVTAGGHGGSVGERPGDRGPAPARPDGEPEPEPEGLFPSAVRPAVLRALWTVLGVLLLALLWILVEYWRVVG